MSVFKKYKLNDTVEVDIDDTNQLTIVQRVDGRFDCLIGLGSEEAERLANFILENGKHKFSFV